jgi:ribosomal protein S18 acetylase RimI-like enzyme
VTSTMAEAVVIRFAEAADEARLVAIDDATWSPLVTPALRPAEPAFFRPQVEPSDTLVAAVGGEIAGYALLGHPTPVPASKHVQMLRGLAVDPGCQGKGIGRALVEAAIREAAARGAVKLSLRVLASNETARRLYEKCGFETEGVLRDEFFLDGRRIDDVLMAQRFDT